MKFRVYVDLEVHDEEAFKAFVKKNANVGNPDHEQVKADLEDLEWCAMWAVEEGEAGASTYADAPDHGFRVGCVGLMDPDIDIQKLHQPKA